jgi:hypothetical protein
MKIGYSLSGEKYILSEAGTVSPFQIQEKFHREVFMFP